MPKLFASKKCVMLFGALLLFFCYTYIIIYPLISTLKQRNTLMICVITKNRVSICDYTSLKVWLSDGSLGSLHR